MFLTLFIFLLTTVFWGFVLWFASRHDQEGVKALAAALVLLFGRKAEAQPLEEPEEEVTAAPPPPETVPAPFTPAEAELTANGKLQRK